MKTPEYLFRNGKMLRTGLTTGTCAAAAAVAAAGQLLTGHPAGRVEIRLPGGDPVRMDTLVCRMEGETAFCQVRKDGGDDPDVTTGMAIGARISRISSGIELDGGEGVGRVTGPGLPCPPGEAAINPVPRKMIRENLESLCRELGYTGGLQVIITAENGREVAKKTFNPRLGIEGGISILGTTGIVEPMSSRALTDTTNLLIDRYRLKSPDRILLTPGNYGQDFSRDFLGISREGAVQFSNFLGEALDYLVYRNYRELLLVGHAGKLVKVAGGIMNTHSSQADCRMEILAAHAALAGGDRTLIRNIMDCPMVPAALDFLRMARVEQEVYRTVLEKIREQVNYRTGGSLRTEVMLFTMEEGLLAATDGAAGLAERIRGDWQ